MVRVEKRSGGRRVPRRVFENQPRPRQFPKYFPFKTLVVKRTDKLVKEKTHSFSHIAGNTQVFQDASRNLRRYVPKKKKIKNKTSPLSSQANLSPLSNLLRQKDVSQSPIVLKSSRLLTRQPSSNICGTIAPLWALTARRRSSRCARRPSLAAAR